MAEEHLILCGGAPKCKQDGGKVHELCLGKNKDMINLDVDALTKKMVEEIPSVMHDLLEIATYVYVGDQLISRGGEKSFDYGNKWHRVLRYRIPVCEYGVWSDDTVTELLQEALSVAAGETYRFEFVKRGPRERPNFLNVGDATEYKFKIEEVVLFSGGLDSFTGAMDEVVGQKKNICMVSHQSNGKLVKLQRDLHQYIASLCKKGPKPLHVPVMINKPKKYTHDKSQRTRSFLFAALGVIVACYENLNRVRFYENGITSCNLPWDGQTLQARATRSTHPRVLYGLSLLISELIGREFTFENPYFDRTKSDVVERLVELQQQACIEATRSCAGSIYRRPCTHCGRCSQCIERRFATLAAKCEEYDPQHIYYTNIFTEALEKTADRAMAAGFASFANRVETMTLDGFTGKFMQEAIEIAKHIGNGDREKGVRQVFDLHVRHARQANRVTDRKLEDNVPLLRKGLLPDTCLLQLVASKQYLNMEQLVRDGHATKAETVARDGAKNIFRNRGDRWEVRFNGGKVMQINNLRGMGYIARLLAKADVPIPATELANPLIDRKLMEKAGLCGAEDVAVGGIEADEVADKETLRKCRERLAEIEAEFEKARKNNDPAKIGELEKEKERVLAYVRASAGLGGQARVFAGEVEKARKAVANAINTAINRIKKMEPRLAQHLDKLIDRGTDCKYEPGCEMDWQLQ